MKKNFFWLGVVLWMLPQLLVAQSLSEIAATYQQSEQQLDSDEPKKLTTSWYLWRQTKRIELYNPKQQTGEVWRLLNDGEVAYTWLLHHKKFAVNYAPSDLKAIKNHPNWLAKASMISPQLLKQLELKPKCKFLNYQCENYSGRIGEYKLEIEWLPELQIPARIKQSTANHITEINLNTVTSLTEAKQPLNSENYEDMDFADIGDNEAHPIAKSYSVFNNLTTLEQQQHHH